MAADYLHNHSDFSALLNILADQMQIQPGLIEKDYWIMHCLYGLNQTGLEFELKGGTSLSKGFKIIDRFSEDIDIHIKPPIQFGINENPKNIKPNNVAARLKFYDWLADTIKMEGITAVERDHNFDNADTGNSGGIRLYYNSVTSLIEGVKDGILLEAGFDTVTPNFKLTISSWAYDYAASLGTIELIDNRAVDIACYHQGYTFVEKLQTIATKFRQEQAGGKERPNFMRQYYDVYRLLENDVVLNFIGTEEYHQHKRSRFPAPDFNIEIAKNEAFLMSDPDVRSKFKMRYLHTKALYYSGQPDFDDILARIQEFSGKL